MKRLSVVAVLLLLAACASPGQSPKSESHPRTARTAIAEENATEWDYVALGDSVTWGMPDRYAEMIEEDLGVTVIVHGKMVSSDHSSRLLERLRTDTRLRQDLREADLITVQIPFNVFGRAMSTYMSSPEACGGDDNQECLREALETFEADVEGIFSETVSLRSPSKALIRAQDQYVFFVGQQKDAEVFEVTGAYWRRANAHIRDVASAHGIPVAQVYDAFMGDGGAEDPVDLGLVSDGKHTTPKGAALMAECFHELGYAYAPSNGE